MIFPKLLNSLYIRRSWKNSSKGRLKTRKPVLPRPRLLRSHFRSTSGTSRKRGNRQLGMRISILKCWTSSVQGSFRGESSCPDSRWWWRRTSTSVSNEFDPWLRKALQVLSCPQGCSITKMKNAAVLKRILTAPSLLLIPSSLHSLFSHLAQDRCLTSKDYKKHLLPKWSRERRV